MTPSEHSKQQALRLVKIASDFPAALRELRKTNPKLAQERAQTNRRLLDMRLD